MGWCSLASTVLPAGCPGSGNIGLAEAVDTSNVQASCGGHQRCSNLSSAVGRGMDPLHDVGQVETQAVPGCPFGESCRCPAARYWNNVVSVERIDAAPNAHGCSAPLAVGASLLFPALPSQGVPQRRVRKHAHDPEPPNLLTAPFRSARTLCWSHWSRADEAVLTVQV